MKIYKWSNTNVAETKNCTGKVTRDQCTYATIKNVHKWTFYMIN